MLGFIAQYFYQSKPPDEDSNEQSASPPVVVESKPKSANPVKPESPTSHSSLAEVNFPSGSVSGSQSALVQRLNQVCANISGRIQCDLRFNWWNLSVVTLLVGVIFPTMTYPLFAVCRLVLGTLYPAYASYKAVRTKNVREYVKWMMYWIVFALFTTFESIGDLFIAFWFPFYYELKIVLLLWLISPVSRGSLGSSMLYRKLVHPNLLKREDEIDRMLGKLQEQGYNTAIRFGSQAFQYVTNLVMTTAIRGGGGLVTQLKKSYSLADLANLDDTDPTRQRDGSSSYPRALGYQGDEDPYFFRERSQSRESQGMGSRESSHYEPMYISNSPMRHPTRRQISEGYGDRASSGYSSGAEFLPVQDEVLSTDDYELYDPRVHSRRTRPINRPYAPASAATPVSPTNAVLRNRARANKQPQEDMFSDEDSYFEATTRMSNVINRQMFQGDSRSISRSSSISDSYFPSEAETDCTEVNETNDEDDENEVWAETFEDPVISGHLSFMVGPISGNKTPQASLGESEGTLKRQAREDLDGERTPIGRESAAHLAAQIQDLERVAHKLKESMEQAPPPIPMKTVHGSIEQRPVPSVGMVMSRATRSRTGSISSVSGRRKSRAPEPPELDQPPSVRPRPAPMMYPNPETRPVEPALAEDAVIRPMSPRMKYPERLRSGLAEIEVRGPISMVPVPFSFPRDDPPRFQFHQEAPRVIHELQPPMQIPNRPTSPIGIGDPPPYERTLSPIPGSSSGLSVSPSKCPHCTIHSWLPHSPHCTKWKGTIPKRRPL